MSSVEPPVEPDTELDSEPIVTRVVTAVATRAGVDPTAIDPPLYEAVDPDALEALVASGAESGLWVAFTYCGYDVVVDSQGRVTIDADGPVMTDDGATADDPATAD